MAYNKTANIIKQLRKKEGLTQAQFAKEIGVSQPHLSDLESGKRNLTEEVLTKIKESLNIPNSLYEELYESINYRKEEYSKNTKEANRDIQNTMLLYSYVFEINELQDKSNRIMNFLANKLNINTKDLVIEDIEIQNKLNNLNLRKQQLYYKAGVYKNKSNTIKTNIETPENIDTIREELFELRNTYSFLFYLLFDYLFIQLDETL